MKKGSTYCRERWKRKVKIHMWPFYKQYGPRFVANLWQLCVLAYKVLTVTFKVFSNNLENCSVYVLCLLFWFDIDIFRVISNSVATKLRRSSKLRRFLSEYPSLSSSSVHFQMPKNLWSFEDFRPKVTKIFWENLTILCTKLSEKVKKYVLFLNFWTSIFPT